MKISNWAPLGRPANTSLWPAGAVTTGPGPGGTGTPVTVADLQVTVDDEGTPLATAATSLDFVGAGVTASGTGATKTITIPGGATATGEVLISDTPAGSPLVFGDLLQNEAGTDLIYAG